MITGCILALLVIIIVLFFMMPVYAEMVTSTYPTPGIYYHYLYLWGSLSDQNANHQLQYMNDLSLLPFVVIPGIVGLILVLGAMYCLISKFPRTKKIRPIELAWVVSGAWFFLALGCFSLTQVFPQFLVFTIAPGILVPSISPFLVGISLGILIFAYGHARGPWLIPPQTWNEVGKHVKLAQQLIALKTNCMGLDKSLEEISNVIGESSSSVKFKLHLGVMKRLIQGYFVEKGHLFHLSAVLVPFANMTENDQENIQD